MDFTGRARRREYWMFVFVNCLISIPVTMLDAVIGFGLLTSLYSLFILLPGLAVTVRRLHDLEKSGWYVLVNWIPLIGTIWFFILMCSEGTRGANKYGADPKWTEGEIDLLSKNLE